MMSSRPTTPTCESSGNFSRRRPTAGGGETHPSFHPFSSFINKVFVCCDLSSKFFGICSSCWDIFHLLISPDNSPIYLSSNISGIFSTKALISSMKKDRRFMKSQSSPFPFLPKKCDRTDRVPEGGKDRPLTHTMPWAHRPCLGHWYGSSRSGYPGHGPG